MTAVTSRVCAESGLNLVPARGQRAYRVAKISYGALNPPARDVSAEDRGFWSRWDVPGAFTVYGAHTKEGAYSESLAWMKRQSVTGPIIDLSRFIDDVPDAAAGEKAIRMDWEERSHMGPRQLARIWREERLLYQLDLPQRGWLVDMETPETLAAIECNLGEMLLEHGLTQGIDVGALAGSDREVTTQISSWIHSKMLDDGTLPVGIRYISRCATGMCYAIWLRFRELGSAPDELDATSDDGTYIEGFDSVFRRVCSRFGLNPH